VTIQGTFGWYSTYLPKFGVEVVMVYKPSACFAFFYIDFVSTLPRSAAKERKWDIPHQKLEVVTRFPEVKVKLSHRPSREVRWSPASRMAVLVVYVIGACDLIHMS